MATCGVSFSVTFTLIYLIFYCMSSNAEKILSNIDWNLQLLMIYTLVFVFIYAEMSLYPIRFGDSALTVMQLFLIITFTLYVINLVLGQY